MLNYFFLLFPAERLHDFDILLSFNNAPPPAKANDVYKLCNHHSGQVAVSATVELSCNRSAHGQYLFVVNRRINATEYLGICEIEVYGRYISIRRFFA